MGKQVLRRIERDIKRDLENQDCADIKFEIGRVHHRVYFTTPAGIRRFMTYAGSPRGQRWRSNQRSLIKRLATQLDR